MKKYWSPLFQDFQSILPKDISIYFIPPFTLDGITITSKVNVLQFYITHKKRIKIYLKILKYVKYTWEYLTGVAAVPMTTPPLL